MKYPYLVKHNGVYYKPGEEVPNDVEEIVEVKPEEQKAEIEKADNSIIEKRKRFSYTKSDLNKMKQKELQSLASEYGYDSTLGTVKLKNLFIKEFGL